MFKKAAVINAGSYQHCPFLKIIICDTYVNEWSQILQYKKRCCFFVFLQICLNDVGDGGTYSVNIIFKKQFVI